MNIIIIGGGSVGTEICTQLAKEGHNITVVDIVASSLTDLVNTCDVIGVVGNGATVSVLEKAGAQDADLLIAVSQTDELNILACTVAKKLGTTHTIARVRNPEYSDLMRLLRDEMGLSLTINPELAAATEIYRMLRFPSAAKIDTFSRGRVDLAEIVIDNDSPLCEKSLNELRSSLNVKFLVCSVLRGDTAYIPSGDFVLQEGDTICVTAPDEDITRFFKAVGEYKEPIKDVLIIGGGRTTYYLQEMLSKGKINSVVIEKDHTLCRELADKYDCTVICDTPTKQELLLREGIDKTDAFLALSNIDEENAISSMYAKTIGVEKIITMISAMSYVDFFKGVGLESIVSPKFSTASFILRYVRSMANTGDADIESLHTMMDGQVEALEFYVKEEIEGITGVPLKHMKSARGVLIACIIHRGHVIIPSGDDVISSGDTVIVVSASGQMKSINDILN